MDYLHKLAEHLPSSVTDQATLTPVTGAVAAFTAFLALYAIKNASSSSQKRSLLPPGPPTKWFWQNPFPEKDVARSLAALANQYGGVYTLSAGSNNFVVVASYDAALEIMEKAGGSTVDRPRAVVASELMARSGRLLFEGAGDHFRTVRKYVTPLPPLTMSALTKEDERAVHTALQPKAAKGYQTIQIDHARHVILNIMADPDKFADHLQAYASSVTIQIMYGKCTPTSASSPEVQRILLAGKNGGTALVPGRFIIESLPALKPFHRLGGMKGICDALENTPGLWWLGRALGAFGWEMAEWARHEQELGDDMMGRVQREMAEGTAGPSFMRNMIETQDEHKLPNYELAELTSILFGAGSDTTTVGLNFAMLAAAAFPEELKKVHQELDRVVGGERAPNFDDMGNLPLLQAFIEEVLRWRPIIPIGIAHGANKDVHYNGFVIPEGTMVLGSHWAISRDPTAYPNPECFLPSRWLENPSSPPSSAKLRTDLRFFTYGFGRRVCPGQHVASRSLFLNIALIFWAFDVVRPSKDTVYDLDGWKDTAVTKPPPFKVGFAKRLDEGVVRRALDEMGGDN
ncbi:cytochrome P450 [Coniophora puteana RWD-64-598 SS2]|uniref:Cytochrome P450 n=1 Tax=Coniophora puteana (strain RWD-64-598) TaxID=741705 RepID=A0A5M3N3I7_CONPW|nr:cytochrome P450 [Coniophora puteana RWD-64-598 SS2]EIW85906.1 cytochrome P450 [Coniophora puteana RWD-64-598 SS2]